MNNCKFTFALPILSYVQCNYYILREKTDLKNYFCLMTYTLAELNFLYTCLPASTFAPKSSSNFPQVPMS